MGYKDDKEAFVSGLKGSSITQINLVSLAALGSVCLYAAIRTRIYVAREPDFIFSWATLVLPPLLAMTWFSDASFLFSFSLFAVVVALLQLVRKTEHGTPLPSSRPASPVKARHQPTKLAPLPALTTYRAHMMIMTVLAILAVDFPMFPRSLAKCETWGTSLMDLGVGSFVFAQGIVSALPILRNPAYISSKMIPKLISVIRKSLPVISLGLARVIAVKGTDYPEHITEYGVHWNFFITLALLPILQVLFHPVLARFSISGLGIALAIVHQFSLAKGLQSYVFNAPRLSLVSANKEGIVSLPGYLAIHLLGLAVGTKVLPPNPSYFRRLQTTLLSSHRRKRRDSDPSRRTAASDLDIMAPRQLGKIAIELSSYTILWWCTLLLCGIRWARQRLFGSFETSGWMDMSSGVSRQLVNLPYILWVAAFNTAFLLSYIVTLDMSILAPSWQPKPKGKTKTRPEPAQSWLAVDQPLDHKAAEATENPPYLLSILNTHGLAIFLLANLLTGAVNFSMKTMYASNLTALVVLSSYTLVVSLVPWIYERWVKVHR